MMQSYQRRAVGFALCGIVSCIASGLATINGYAGLGGINFGLAVACFAIARMELHQ